MASKARQAGGFVKYKISWLTRDGNESITRASLAQLRRGIGKAPGSRPELWEITLAGLPEELLSYTGTPSYGEWAVHTALTLYALHQQGKDRKSECMNEEKQYLGRAARKLIRLDQESENAVTRRFQAVAMSESYERLSWHLRGLIQLFRFKNVTLDYPALATDLYWFQVMEVRDGIRLKWGQDFYRQIKDSKTDNMD